MASASLTCITGMDVALPLTMSRHSSTAEEERSRNGKSSMRPVGADSSAIAVDACAKQPRSAASSAAACSTGIGPRSRVRFWGRAPASEVGAARGGDVKAPRVVPSWFEQSDVASAVLQCPGQVAGGAFNAPAPSKGLARPVAASSSAGVHSFGGPLAAILCRVSGTNLEFCFYPELLRRVLF